jgi:hypothetical protein
MGYIYEVLLMQLLVSHLAERKYFKLGRGAEENIWL